MSFNFRDDYWNEYFRRYVIDPSTYQIWFYERLLTEFVWAYNESLRLKREARDYTMNITSIGSTIKQTVFTIFRVLRVDDEGRLEVVKPLVAISGPTLCWSAVDGVSAGVLAAVPCVESLAAANRWHAIPAGARFVRFEGILSGAGLPTGVVLQPMYSQDAGVTAKPIPLVKAVVNRGVGSELIHEWQGADGAATRADGWLPPLLVDRTEIPANATHVQLRAAKNGGGAGTALLGYVSFEG